MKKYLNKSAIFLTALAPILCVYMPRPPISGSQFLIYPILGFILSAIISLLLNKRILIDSQIYFLIFLLLLYSICLAFSFLLNSQYLRATGLLELLRPLLLVIFLLYGYYVALSGGSDSIKRGLLIAAHIILLGQLIIGFSQALGYSFFNGIYSAEKVFQFGSLFRITGSLANPNIFAWIVSQASIIVLVLDSKKSKYLWILIGMLLVIISSSRSIFILFPLMIFFLNRNKKSSIKSKNRNFWRKFLLGIIVIFVFVYAIILFADKLPYLAQITQIWDSGSLESVNTLNTRFEWWQHLYEKIASEYEIRWLFGLGNRQVARVADNDYIYVFFRIGIVGFLVHLAIIFQAFKIFIKAKNPVAIIGLEYLVFSLIFGLFADTISGWFLPLFLYLFLGLTVGLMRREGNKTIMKNLSYSSSRSYGVQSDI